MTRILVVEDDPSIRMGLEDTLTAKGYQVEVVGRGGDGAERAMSGRYDLVVLDVMLPDIDGFEVCRRIRQSRGSARRMPIIMLSARGAELDRVRGLELGADDYVTKPFSPRELVARVRTVVRRTRAPAGPRVLQHGAVRLDPGSRTLTVDGAVRHLTATEFNLLELLMRNPRQVLRRSLIYDRVWGYDFGPDSHALDVYVGYLRRKLESAGEPRLIHTVRGVGYALREP